MVEVSKLSDGITTYDIKDATARNAIAALEGGSYFLGVTTTALTDQATTNPVTIDGKSVTAKNGNMVVYARKEFVWGGTSAAGKWIEFGDLSSLGSLAYKNSASGSYTPAGSISKITPSGTISKITPAGSVSSITPAGNVSVTKSTDTVYSITDVGTAPSLAYDSANEKLTFNAGTVPTIQSKTVMTGATATFAGTAVTPTFTGTAVTPTFTGTDVTPTFTGEQATITVS